MPFAKTGGLADVAGALPKALRALGIEAVAILPRYSQVDPELLDDNLIDVTVEWRGRTFTVPVRQSQVGGAPAYLIESNYFSRPSIYGYADDHERFAFFSRAALSFCRHIEFKPDIVHGNDWPCGFGMAELRRRRSFDPFYEHTGSVFSIHNLAYQGRFDPGDLWWLGFGEYPDRDAFMFNGAASALKAGLIAADALTTVSRRYALEIQTPEHGHGLDWLLRARSDKLVGITNGVDYDIWNPATDPHIAANYSAEDLSGKRECKIDLLRRFGLSLETWRPIIAIISRLVAQKGYDLIRQLASPILQTGAYFIALGAGAKEYEDFLQGWHDSAPNQVGIYKGYAGEPLAHQIEAGADIFLMPSLFEPCGLNQMYSLRYGTVPVVRATGGLDDTVENYDPIRQTGTGFKFQAYSAGALLEKIREALYFYERPDEWRVIQQNGMSMDNSWTAAARKYKELYRNVAGLLKPH